MAEVRLEHVAKRFGDVEAVKDLSLTIEDGRFTVLVGPSGCGKTTTLRLIAGLEQATEGRIFIGARDVTRLEPKDRNVAMVFQNYALYPHMRVYDNIAFGLMARKMPKDEIDQRVRRAAQMLGIEELLHRRPRELSGGQQQRVAIGRAIVREPNVFLFDEPLSNLDAKLRVDMRTELLRLHREIRTTVIYVTHDQEEAMTLGDRIIIMNYGVVMQAGSPREVYYRPQNRFVASFIGSPSMNMIPGRFESGMFLGEEIRLPVSDEVVPSREVLLGVRPEDVYIQGTLPSERETQPVEMMLEVIELLGARAILSLARGSLSLKAVVEERVLESIREGDLIPVTFDRQRLHFFDAQSEKRIALGMESKNEREIVTKVGHD